MGIKAEDYIKRIPDNEDLEGIKNSLIQFNEIYNNGDFKEMLSAFIVLLDTIQMIPYWESLFFSVQQQLQEKYNLEEGIVNMNIDNIDENEIKQLQEWLNFMIIAIAGLASKFDTIQKLAEQDSDDILKEKVKHIKELDEDNMYQA